MELNIKDRKILAELDLNARATYQEISKKVQLSKETTIYRIKQLEKNEIIKRYSTLVNFGQLGYTGFAVYTRLQNINEKIKKEIIDYLEKKDFVYWVALVGGGFDLAYALASKTVFDFNKIYYEILNKYGKYFSDSKISVRAELRQYKRNYLINSLPEKYKTPFFGRQIKEEKLDKLDTEILSIISNNARISIIDLSTKLKKPASTISLRIKAMKNRGIIQGFTTYIRAQNFGMQSYRLLLHLDNMNEISRNKLFSYVNETNKMVLAIETVGEWNFEITLEVENQEELQKEISKLRDQFKDQINKVEFLIMFEDDLMYNPYPFKKR